MMGMQSHALSLAHRTNVFIYLGPIEAIRVDDAAHSRAEKSGDVCGDFIGGRVQCEVSSVENVDLRVRDIALVGRGLDDSK